jgi:hypothetical protein
MLFAGKMEKERSSNSVLTYMFSFLSKKLISLLFDGTLKQRLIGIAAGIKSK